MTKVELFNKFLEDSDATVTISFLFCKENYGLFFKRRDLACILSFLGDIEKEDFYEEYTFHYLLCNLGKCYKTYEEAEKHVEEDIKSYKNMQKV